MVAEDKSTLIERALDKVENKAVLINLLARRVRQLNKNSRPLVEKIDGEDNISVALREVIDGKIYPVFKTGETDNTSK